MTNKARAGCGNAFSCTYPDCGLGPQQRPLSEAFNGFALLRKIFGKKPSHPPVYLTGPNGEKNLQTARYAAGADVRGGSMKFDPVGVHLNHCYQGEYEDSCKYGDENCPAGQEQAAADTAFGPADHPELPLGLRRHPRYSLKVVVGHGDLIDLTSFYAHDEPSIRKLASMFPPADIAGIEHWDGRWWREI